MPRRTRHAKKIDCGGPSATRCRYRQEAPSKFDKRSLRVIKRGGAQITIGCPRGKWNPKQRWKDRRGKWHVGKCSVGTRAQTITYPLGSEKCSVCRR
jgi:hypothetical protein